MDLEEAVSQGDAIHLAGDQVQIVAQDGTADLVLDCNVGNATYTTADDGTMAITMGVSTLAFCENSQDQTFRDNLSAASIYFFDGENSSDGLGLSVSWAGDVDVDGYDEILVGAHQFNSDFGRVYVHSGRDGTTLFTFDGTLVLVADAVEAGTDIRGYFAWSLLDNFEWGEGFTQRFGLAWVDFATQDRRLKESGRWYGGVARENGFDA